ncbi:peptide deformylase [Pseudomonadota bacterium]
MALLDIQTGEDNKILRKKSEPLEQIDEDMLTFLDDMKETMIKKDGIGLAAPQVGKNIRVVICTLGSGTKDERIFEMINPEILSRSGKMEVGEEGCLSLPAIFDNVERHKSISVKYNDRRGEEFTLNLTDLDARIIQHEVDHIDGVLFVDRVKKGSVLVQPNSPHLKI